MDEKSSPGLRILLTNLVLAGRSGTEIFTEQLADRLRARGHEPMIYSPTVGPLGEAMRRRGLMVFDRIEQIKLRPDVIHGHHGSPTVTALAAFPDTPAIFVSHSVEAEFDRPPLHPNILRYFAVSRLIPHRWASPELPVERFELLRNAVDTERFPQRTGLPKRPRTAALVSKYGSQVELVRAVCNRAGLDLTVCGHGVGQVSSNLPEVFGRSDVVFASGRSALEAMATGCAVVLTEGGSFYGMITLADIENLLDGNLGVAVLSRKASEKSLSEAVSAYHPEDAAQVSAYVREHVSLDRQVERLESVYESIRGSELDGETAQAYLARYIEDYVPRLGQGNWQRLARYVASDLLGAYGHEYMALQLSERLEAEQRVLSAVSNQTETASLEDIAYAFRLFLGRRPGPDEWLNHVNSHSGRDLKSMANIFLNSAEFRSRFNLRD